MSESVVVGVGGAGGGAGKINSSRNGSSGDEDISDDEYDEAVVQVHDDSDLGLSSKRKRSTADDPLDTLAAAGESLHRSPSRKLLSSSSDGVQNSKPSLSSISNNNNNNNNNSIELQGNVKSLPSSLLSRSNNTNGFDHPDETKASEPQVYPSHSLLMMKNSNITAPVASPKPAQTSRSFINTANIASPEAVKKTIAVPWSSAIGKRPPRDMKRLDMSIWYVICRCASWGDTPALYLRSPINHDDCGFYKPPINYSSHTFQVGDQLLLSGVGYSQSRNKVALNIAIYSKGALLNITPSSSIPTPAGAATSSEDEDDDEDRVSPSSSKKKNLSSSLNNTSSASGRRLKKPKRGGIQDRAFTTGKGLSAQLNLGIKERSLTPGSAGSKDSHNLSVQTSTSLTALNSIPGVNAARNQQAQQFRQQGMSNQQRQQQQATIQSQQQLSSKTGESLSPTAQQRALQNPLSFLGYPGYPSYDNMLRSQNSVMRMPSGLISLPSFSLANLQSPNNAASEFHNLSHPTGRRDSKDHQSMMMSLKGAGQLLRLGSKDNITGGLLGQSSSSNASDSFYPSPSLNPVQPSDSLDMYSTNLGDSYGSTTNMLSSFNSFNWGQLGGGYGNVGGAGGIPRSHSFSNSALPNSNNNNNNNNVLSGSGSNSSTAAAASLLSQLNNSTTSAGIQSHHLSQGNSPTS